MEARSPKNLLFVGQDRKCHFRSRRCQLLTAERQAMNPLIFLTLAMIQEKKTLSYDSLLSRWLDEATKHAHRGSNKKQRYTSVRSDQFENLPVFLPSCQTALAVEQSCVWSARRDCDRSARSMMSRRWISSDSKGVALDVRHSKHFDHQESVR